MTESRYLRLFLACLLGLIAILNCVQATPVQSQDLTDTNDVQARGLLDLASPLEARTRKPVCRKTKKVTCKRRRSENPFVKRATLAQIWATIAASDQVNTGATKHFVINPKQGGLWGTTELSGCTAVVLVNGKNILIGHYCQEGSGARSVIDDKAANKKEILDKLDNNLYKFEESDDTESWIVHSSRNSEPVGLQPIKDKITQYDCCKKELIHPARYGGGSGAEYHNQPNGKIVVQTIPNSAGGFELRVYNQNDTPVFRKRYDAQGNPCA